MEQLSNNAYTRLRERAFIIWEQAGGDASEEYSLWHKLRPMLSHRGFRGMTSARGNEVRGGKTLRDAKAT
jgi:hypothetical protein